MSTQNICFLWRNKKIITIFRVKKKKYVICSFGITNQKKLAEDAQDIQ